MFWICVVVSVIGFPVLWNIGLFSAKDMYDAIGNAVMAAFAWVIIVLVFWVSAAKTGLFVS